jgi:carbamoyltransferase
MWVLGVNLSHDRSVCLMRDGEVHVAIEEERLDRIKHSEGFMVKGYFERFSKVIPMKAITYCLDAAGIGIDDLDLVVGNRPLNDGSARRLLRDLPIRDKSKIRELPMPSHHLAHAYSCYFASPFPESAILVVDGVGSRIPRTNRIEKHTIYAAEGSGIASVRTLSYAPDYSDFGLGLLYEFFTAKLGFVTEWGHPGWGAFGCGGYVEAGKTMGLAPYGRPRPDWEPLLHFEGDDVSVTLEALEGAYARWYAAEGDGYDPSVRGAWKAQFAKDVARKVQDEVEKAVVYLAERTYHLTGLNQLCLTGGVALNSVANQRIAADGPFDSMYILPPAGDSGICIGTAAYGYYGLLGGENRHHLASAAVGRSYPDVEVLDALKSADGQLEFREADIGEVARLIAAHEVVGWFQGGAELGPRSLGQRSTLADARHPGRRDAPPPGAKHRESFRPYAPSVLEEHASDWFDMSGESPFMLLVPAVLAERRARVPAITHVDGTARVQTVSAHLNAPYHELISEFYRLTGVPMVLNTSFNDAGQPIVETPFDAVRAFLGIDLDYLYIGPYLAAKVDRVKPGGHPSHHPV